MRRPRLAAGAGVLVGAWALCGCVHRQSSDLVAAPGQPGSEAAAPPGALEHYLAGELDEDAGDDADAAVELQYAAIADDDPFLYLRIAEVDARLGRLDDAEDAVQTALRLDPHYADAYVVEGEVCSADHDVSGALASWARAEKEAPADPRAYLLRYGAFLDAGRAADGEAELRALVRAVPRSAEGHYRLALVLNDRGAFREALAEAETARTLAPWRKDVPGLLGEIEEKLGRLGEAAADYAKAFAATHDRTLAAREVAVLMELGRATEARAVAGAADDGPVDPVERVAQGRVYLAAGAPAQAERLARSVLALGPDPEASLLLGDALAAKGDTAGALAAYAAIPDGDPNARPARGAASALLVAQGKASEAAALLAPLVARFPADTQLASALADAYVHAGDQTRALDLARRLVAAHPADASAESLLASLLLHDGEAGSLGEAEALARKAAAASPGDGSIAGTLGEVLLREGRPADAVSALQRATRLLPARADLLDLLGEAYVASGDATSARAAYRAALGRAREEDLRRRIQDDLHDLDARRAANAR